MANNQGKESSSPSPSPSSNPTAHNTASRRRTIVLFFLGAIVVPIAAAIAPMMMAPNPHLSTQQRNQDAMVFLGIGFSAALGLAAYLYYDKQQQQQQQQKQAASDTSKTRGGAGAGASAASKAPASASSESSSSSSKQQPKDIWKVGASSTTGLKKPKVAYNEKPFGSKYYYAHNDSNTTGGYKDGLKMEDYRMNGPRLLSVNGLAVTDQDMNIDNENIDNENIDNSIDNIDEPSDSGASVEPRNNNNERASSKPSAKPRITARDPHTKNVTRYLWDDSGNGKGIATIRVDVLPGNKLGEFVDWKDAGVVDVKASLPGEGLLAEIITVRDRPDVPSYRLKIDKLYGDAADVKVILKPKRLLLKIFKKKHGFLSKNSDNMGAWPQPHRKL